MVNKSSSFADFVRFRPYTYAHTQHGRQLSKGMMFLIRLKKKIGEEEK